MQPQMMFGTPQTNNGLVSDLSQSDLSSHMPFVGGSGGLNVNFFYSRVRTEDPLDPAKNGAWKTVLCVAKQPKGDRLTVAMRMISERMAQQIYPREFAFFKSNQDVPTDGTPLHELPGISMSQIGILVVHGIRSIEDLTAQPQETVNGMGMDAISAFTLARRWVEKQTANGDLIQDSQKEAATNAELTRLRRSEKENSDRIAALTAQVDLLSRMGGGNMAEAINMTANRTQMTGDDDGTPHQIPDDGMFAGGDIAQGADDLNDEPTPAPTKADPLSLKRK